MDHSKGLERRDVVHENARGARAYHTQTLAAIFHLLANRTMQVDYALAGSFTLDSVFESIKGKTSITPMA